MQRWMGLILIGLSSIVVGLSAAHANGPRPYIEPVTMKIDLKCNSDKGEISGHVWIEFSHDEKLLWRELMDCSGESGDWAKVTLPQGLATQIRVESWLFSEDPDGVQLCEQTSDAWWGEGVHKMRVECWSPFSGHSKDCTVLTIKEMG
jgi:hypothetical protein